ncbi:MAG: peptidyl-tRNA hydrolase [Candidatus Aenigmarchaeota archaeon]|nr:peptidyl-tRNA hydrolase [Candidatus Aenigmarchaeota archaeon]
MKQAIVIRNDLKMEKGKIAAQASHASISAFLEAEKKKSDAWLKQGMKKIVLKVDSEKELLSMCRNAKAENLPCVIITDAGLTQVEPGTVTALGIGPDNDAIIDKVTSKLKLL